MHNEIACSRPSVLVEGVLDAGDEAAHFIVINAKSGLEHLLGERRVGGEEGNGELGGTRVLAIEGGDGKSRLGFVWVELEVDEATGKYKEIASIDGLVEELVGGWLGGGGDEAHEQCALGEEEDFGSTGVHVRRVDSAGLVVDAGNGKALRVEGAEVGGADEVDSGAEVSGEVGGVAEQLGSEVEGLHGSGRLAGQAVDVEGELELLQLVGAEGHAEVLQRVLVSSADSWRQGCGQPQQQ
ncbi:hypothetical protein GOP47_0030664 [Adiantum capillus-veneris]|nr:hypothetical protein GOP47_0030664 [Adiantum capillus-veneris]